MAASSRTRRHTPGFLRAPKKLSVIILLACGLLSFADKLETCYVYGHGSAFLYEIHVGSVSAPRLNSYSKSYIHGGRGSVSTNFDYIFRAS